MGLELSRGLACGFGSAAGGQGLRAAADGDVQGDLVQASFLHPLASTTTLKDSPVSIAKSVVCPRRAMWEVQQIPQLQAGDAAHTNQYLLSDLIQVALTVSGTVQVQLR
jgi:hypothetical protein